LLLIAVIATAVAPAIAMPRGGDEETARAMLASVIEHMQRDPDGTIAAMKTSAKWKNKNIYPFCFRIATGELLTGQNPGKDIRSLKTGDDMWGQRVYDAIVANGTKIVTVKYRAPKPEGGEGTKISFVVEVNGIGCGVGYYEEEAA
jgi:hypothetical protein